MMKYEVTEGRRGDFHVGPDSHLVWLRLVVFGVLLTFESNKVNIFKFVR